MDNLDFYVFFNLLLPIYNEKHHLKLVKHNIWRTLE